MNWRAFFHGSCDRTIQLLERELAEARKERDYFKGRADRIELMLMPNPVIREKIARVGTPFTAGRKTWEQILEEHQKKLAAEEAASNATVSEHGNPAPARSNTRQSGSN